jgi:hypothetical protein
MSDNDYKKENFSHKYLKEMIDQDKKSLLTVFLKKQKILILKVMSSTNTYTSYMESDLMENVCDKLQHMLIVGSDCEIRKILSFLVKKQDIKQALFIDANETNMEERTLHFN